MMCIIGFGLLAVILMVVISVIMDSIFWKKEIKKIEEAINKEQEDDADGC